MLTDKRLADIAQETSLNDHGEACRLAAVALGQHELAELFAANRRRQLELGHLSPKLADERNALRQRLLDRAKAILGPVDHQRLRAAI